PVSRRDPLRDLLGVLRSEQLHELTTLRHASIAASMSASPTSTCVSIRTFPATMVARTSCSPSCSIVVQGSGRSTKTILVSGGTTVSPRPISRSEEHTSELQSRGHLVCRLLLEKKKKNKREPCQDTTNEFYYSNDDLR